MSTYKTPVHVPTDARPCRNCRVLMPIPGIVRVSRVDPGLCSDCAGEGTIYERLVLNEDRSDEPPRLPPAQQPEVAMPENNHQIPDGWGPVERSKPMPRGMNPEWAQLLALVNDTAGKDWKRIKAPTDYKATYLSAKVRDTYPHIERMCRKIGDVRYFYYRLKEEQPDADD